MTFTTEAVPTTEAEAPREPRGPLVSRSEVVDLTAVAVLGVAATYGFHTVYGGWRYLLAGSLGVLLGAVVALWVTRRGHGALVTAAGLVAVFLLLGGPLVLPATTLAGIVPTLETVTRLLGGAVTAWRGLLTTLPPVGEAGTLMVAPWFSGLLAGALAMTLARRSTRPWPPLLPIGALVAVTILFGTDQPAGVWVQGGLIAAVSLGWLSVREGRNRPWLAGESGSYRTAVAVLMAGALAAGGVVASPYVPLSDTNPRFILRDRAVPPFDPDQYPSPLAEFRVFKVRDGASAEDTALLEVSGMPAGARIALATLDTYDGVVFGVAGGSGRRQSSGYFEPVGTEIPTDSDGERATVEVRILDEELADVWVPMVGELASIEFDGDPGRAAQLRDSFRYNRGTNGAATAFGLAVDDRYRMAVVVPDTVNRDERPDVVDDSEGSPASLVPEAIGVPDRVRQLAGDFVGDAQTALERAEALEASLVDGGGYSDGLAGDNAALLRYRSGHGAKRLADFLAEGQEYVGNDEQYATAFALMARAQGFASRVVVGFAPDPETPGATLNGTLRGDAVRAWPEVAFDTADGIVWVPFDPTPTDDPQQLNVVRPETPLPAPQPLPPPPPTRTSTQILPDDLAEPDREEEPDDGFVVPREVWIAMGALGSVLLVVGLPIAVIVLLKVWRRRRRRRGPPDHQIAGGWREVVDRAVDLGARPPARPTRLEGASSIGSPVAVALAERADAASFGPTVPQPGDADAYWADVEAARSRLRAQMSPWQKFRALVSTRSLRRGGGGLGA